MRKRKRLGASVAVSDGVTVDDEQIEVVEHFKYLGSPKSADGNCSKDTISRLGMAKKRMFDLVPIWKEE